jgi:DNA-binding NarL/FixJ family response regulator
MAAHGSTKILPEISNGGTDASQVSRASSRELVVDTQRTELPPVFPAAKLTTVVIEPRTLIRDCLAKCLLGVKSDEAICASPSVADWLHDNYQPPIGCLVLLCTGDRQSAEIERDICVLSKVFPAVLIVLLSDGENVAQILSALDKGARGYIPTSMSLEVVLEAMQLVRAGGVFVPASSLLASRNAIAETAAAKAPGNGLFTARQAAVVDALRQGKSNKIIAYELNMRESTVKVHVRNIMKKLNARNRTEVAFRVNSLATNGDIM